MQAVKLPTRRETTGLVRTENRTCKSISILGGRARKRAMCFHFAASWTFKFYAYLMENYKDKQHIYFILATLRDPKMAECERMTLVKPNEFRGPCGPIACECIAAIGFANAHE